MKLSIITITYNDPIGLEKTLNSLKPLALAKLEWEHIVVDSSPDKNKHLINPQTMKHFVVPPQGVYNALNFGLAQVTGDYIWCLNGGDLLYSAENLISAAEYLKQNLSVDLLMATVSLTRGNRYLYSQTPKQKLLLNIIGSNFLCHQGLIYKKSIFKSVGPFSEAYKLASDYEHHFLCYIKKAKTQVFRKTVASFDVSGSSADFNIAFAEFKKVHKELWSQLPLWLNIANKIFYTIFYIRISILKFIKKSFLGPVLQPLWVWWKRLLAK